jgi:hypothetical protein
MNPIPFAVMLLSRTIMLDTVECGRAQRSEISNVRNIQRITGQIRFPYGRKDCQLPKGHAPIEMPYQDVHQLIHNGTPDMPTRWRRIALTPVSGK